MDSIPKLVVFDLDYTLWPFYADAYLTLPLKKKDGVVYDKNGHKFELYPDSRNILQQLHAEGYKIGVASRTSEIQGANKLLELYDLNKYIHQKEIYPGCKKEHFSRLQSKQKISNKDMLFFDDEWRNVRDLKQEGVTCVFVKNGISWNYIKQGLDLHKNKLVELNHTSK